MNTKAFLMVEVLIASLIISSGIIASFFLIRSGILNLSKHTDSSYILSNLPYVINYIDTQQTLPSETDILGMKVKFKQSVLKTYNPTLTVEEGTYLKLSSEVSLIKVDFELKYKNSLKTYTYYKIVKTQTGDVDQQ